MSYPKSVSMYSKYNIYIGEYQNSKNCWDVAEKLRKLGYEPKLKDCGYCISFVVFESNDYTETYATWLRLVSDGFNARIN